MPSTYVIVVLLIVVALLIFMVSKLKCHAVIELLAATVDAQQGLWRHL